MNLHAVSIDVLQHPDLEGKRIVFYSSHDAHKRANAAALIACYVVS